MTMENARRAGKRPQAEERHAMLESRIRRLESHFTEVDAALEGILSIVKKNMAVEEEENSFEKPMVDKVWMCFNCGSKLGIYNDKSEELRIRYKDHLVYLKAGKGGFIRVPCRKCAYMNELESESEGK
jgi:hypothetical protein